MSQIGFLSSIVNPFDNAEAVFHQYAIDATAVAPRSADRWKWLTNTATNVRLLRSNDVPTLSDGMPFPIRHSFYVSPDQVWTPVANELAHYQHVFEFGRTEWMYGVHKLKFGFWYKTNKAGPITIGNYVDGNSAGRYKNIRFEPVADSSWRPFTFELDPQEVIPSIGTPASGILPGMIFQFVFGCGTDYIGPENSWETTTIVNATTTIKCLADQSNFLDNVSNEFRFTAMRCAPIFYDGQDPDLWQIAPKDKGVDQINCERYLEKSYDLDINPATTGQGGVVARAAQPGASNGNGFVGCEFRTAKRLPNSVVRIFNNSTGAEGSVRFSGLNINILAESVGQNSFILSNQSGSAIPATGSTAAFFHYLADSEF